MNKLRYTLLITALTLFMLCHGQGVKLFTASGELSSTMITHLYQDSHSTIWISTENGLNSYNGARFKKYRNNPHDTNSLLSDHVTCTFEDSQGRFFIGTLQGVQILDLSTGSFKTIPMYLNGNHRADCHITSITEGSNANILVSTSGHGAFTLSRREGDMVFEQNTSICPSFYIDGLLQDSQDRIWAVTSDHGVTCYDPERSVTPLKSWLEQNNTSGRACICKDKNDRIYVSFLKTGLSRYLEEEGEFETVAGSDFFGSPIMTLHTAGENEILVGTDGNGMRRYNLSRGSLWRYRLISANIDYRKAKVHAILRDNQGNTWLGCYQKGVAISSPINSGFDYVGHNSTENNSIGSTCIMSLWSRPDGTLLVGTDTDGLYLTTSDGKTLNHFQHINGNLTTVPHTIMSIFEDSRHQIWLGGYLSGLRLLDPSTGTCHYVELPDSAANSRPSVFGICEDSRRRLWVATMGSGIYCINPRTHKATKLPTVTNGTEYGIYQNVIHNRWVNCIIYSRERNRIYYGTYDGLGCYDMETESTTTAFGRNEILFSEVITSLYEESGTNLWVGTTTGLILLNTNSLESHKYTVEDGLPSSSIQSIQPDNHGNLWISTQYGLSRFNLSSKQFVNFYANDGLQSNEFSRSASTSRMDTLYFGGTDGITLFNPNTITRADYTKRPTVRVSDFYIHSQQVNSSTLSGRRSVTNAPYTYQSDLFRLAYHDNSFSIEFSALDFYNPKHILYQYRINSSAWTSLPSGVSQVSFSNLKAGTYHFEVKSRDNFMESDVRKFTVRIRKPWYGAWYMMLIYLLIFSSIAAAFSQVVKHKIKLRRQNQEHENEKRLNESKMRFFINMSHEIRTPMSLIISPLQTLMESDSDPVRQRYYGHIYRSAQRITRLMNQLLDIRKIDARQLHTHFTCAGMEPFVNEVMENFKYEAGSKGIELILHSQPDIFAWIDTKNFDKVIFNLISNALKYTPQNGKVSVFISTGTDLALQEDSPLRDYVEISVSDNGIGVSHEDKARIFERFFRGGNNQNQTAGAGIGLNLAAYLVKLHYGTIEVKDNPGGTGTTFTVRIPHGKSHLSQIELDNYQELSSLPALERKPETVPNTEKRSARTRYKVMIVDDESDLRRYISQELSEDFRITECSQGKEALESILKEQPDLVITDVMMPVMDGMTLCRKIKQNININHIPVILLTAKSAEEDNIEALRLGADAYITKPFKVPLLRKTALNLIKGRESLKNTFSGNQEQSEKIQKVQADSPDERLLGRIVKVINENLGNENLSVTFIAGEVGISPSHLHRKMKELTNQTTRDFIKNVRLKQAGALLAEKRHTITEVAALTGFANLTYFSTVFKEMYGMPPSAYMAMHAEKDNANQV